jgi:tetratricopeptide (TPR) repeat protein
MDPLRPADRPTPTPPAPRRPRAFRLGGTLCLALAAAGLVVLYPHLRAAYHRGQARKALDRYDFPAARARLSRCLEVWPDSAQVHFLMAQACRRDGDLDAARQHLERAGKLGWDDRQVQLERRLLQAQSGVVPPVEGVLRLYLADGSGDERLILEALARGCLQGNLLDRAYYYTRLWTERYPDDWQARFWHARVLERGLRLDLAAEAYQEVLRRKPDYPEAHVRLGQVLLRRGRYSEALPHLEAFLRHRPDDPDALLALARCQRSLCPPEEARATLDRLLALPGDQPGGWLLRGLLELDSDRPGEALPWLERALAKAPHDLEVNQALATALRRLKRTDEAQKYARRAGQIRRDLKAMEEILEDILHRPDDPSPRLRAGETLVRLGHPDEAARWFVSALLLDPGHRPTRKALADCIRRLGDPKLEEAYRAVLADPTPPDGPAPRE